jgi:hypothetical protein
LQTKKGDAMDRLLLTLTRWLAVVFLISSSQAFAAPHNEVVKADLESLIRAAASYPAQFAVTVPHAVSDTAAGLWTVSNNVATWQYTVRIPTAVSLSFHAINTRLPASARLIVKGASTTAVYRNADIRKGVLWSRIAPGEALSFTLTVTASDRGLVNFNIDAFQVGYRGLGGQVVDHPIYRAIKAASGISATTACVQNYQCHVTSANTPLGAATVALVISNLFQCTGTLVNAVQGDNTPYILTARHCETGVLGGGNPSIANDVTVYWDAVSPCNSTMLSIYQSNIVTQSGAVTVVEQQDAWLIRLNESPAVSDAQLAGFDASGGTIQGGYTVHHALGYDKQFTAWTGSALSVQQSGVLGSTYQSNFWEVVNGVGNIGPGASGSALADQNDRLVGSLTLGRMSSDTSGYEACPASSPSAPNGANGAADFTSLAAVWNSTADATSSTGSTTLKKILDANNTGTLVTSSVPAATMTFTADDYSAAVGTSVQVTWNAANATQCTAGGGVSGDGWSGVFPGTGSHAIDEQSAAEVTYSLVCTLSGNRKVNKSLTVLWGSPSPTVNFTASFAKWTGQPSTLTWLSNVSPCSINGGSLSLSSLPSSGSTTTTENTPRNVVYEIVCGTGTNRYFTSASTSYVTASVTFTSNGTDRLLGQPLVLNWQTLADTCVPAGGAPNDGWTSTAFPSAITGQSFQPTINTVGTYTYTLTCTSGSLSLTKNLVITVENNTPYVTLAINRTSYTFTGLGAPADGFILTWNSNLTNCTPSSTPPGVEFQGNNDYPSGSAIAWGEPGSYQFVVTCNPYNTVVGQIVSSAVTGTVVPPAPPTATISINPTGVTAGQSFTVTWSSTNTSNCIGTGGIPGLAWIPPYNSGSLTYMPTTVGQYTFGVSCASIYSAQPNATAQATVTVTAAAAATATLTASPTTITKGQSTTLSWSSTNATSCSASGGPSGSAWTGTQSTSGTMIDTPTATGGFTYNITCVGAGASAQAQVLVTVADSPPSASGGHSGGGGALDTLPLATLAGVASMGLRRRRPAPHRSSRH